MLIIPAIDIMAGKVVRLAKGAFDKKTVYKGSAVVHAKQWQKEGAKLIHVVDLDGARAGSPQNFDPIVDLIRSVEVDVEVGGGIRAATDVKRYLEAGAARVVLSTKVLEDASFLQQKFIKEQIARVIVSLDIKSMSEIKFSGDSMSLSTGSAAWESSKNIEAASFVKWMSLIGVQQINFSDIERDGMMCGPDIMKIRSFLDIIRKVSVNPLFCVYAGGISSLEDIINLAQMDGEGVEGVIVGRALYEKKFSLTQALEAAVQKAP